MTYRLIRLITPILGMASGVWTVAVTYNVTASPGVFFAAFGGMVFITGINQLTDVIWDLVKAQRPNQ